MLDKLQKQWCRTGGTGWWTCYFSWTLCLLLKCSQSKFLLCRYFLELPESFPQAFCRRSTCCSKRLLGFSSAIYAWYNNVYVIIFFPLYSNTLEFFACRMFLFGLSTNHPKSRLNRHFSSCTLSDQLSYKLFIFVSFCLGTSCLV